MAFCATLGIRIRKFAIYFLVGVVGSAGAVESGEAAPAAGPPQTPYGIALMYEMRCGIGRGSGAASRWYGLSSAQGCADESSADGFLGDR